MKIINLGNVIYTNYIIATDNGAILIDFGNKMSYEKFLKKLQKAGLKKEDIKCAILTHVHADHLSYMKELMDDVHPTLYVGVGARENILRGYDNHVKYTSKLNKALTKMTLKMQGGPAKWTPFDIADYNPIYVADETYIEGMDAVVVSLPGHTLDGIGLAKKDGVFFVGDAIMTSLPAKNMIPLLVESADAMKKSYETLLDSNANIFYTGHGMPVTRGKLLTNKISFDKVKEL